MNAFYYNQRLSARILAAVALFSLVAGLVPTQAFARDHNDRPINCGNGEHLEGVVCVADLDPNVTLCHSTNAPQDVNPYNKITTDSKSIVNLPNGHNNDSNDIIPLFQYNYGSGLLTYPGKNLTTTYAGGVTGQQILNNNCNIPPTTGTLTVTKIMVNNDGGTKVVANFPLFITLGAGSPVSITSGVARANLAPGTYTVSETQDSNYTASFSASCPNGVISLAAGENKSCTITNDDKAVAPSTGTIIIVKNTVGGNGTFNFISQTLGNFSLTTTAGTATQTFSNKNVGTYAVSETIPSGWNLTSATCSDQSPVNAISLQADETVTCTFTNTAQGAKTGIFRIIKQVIGKVIADYSSFSFSLDGSLTPTPFEADGSNDIIVSVGAHTAVESAAADYNTVHDTGCTAAQIVEGQTSTCTITNTWIPTCNDGIQNQNETSVDTGGPCPGPVTCQDDGATNYNQEGACTYNYESVCIDPNANLLVNGSFEEPVITSPWAKSAITGWTVTKVSDNSTSLGEIWRGLVTPSHLLQNLELDGDYPTKITQATTTIPGATYELRFDFAARSGGDASDNSVIATADTTTIKNVSTANTKWTTYGGTFVADASTDVALADNTLVGNSLGTLVDNAVLCLVRVPVVDFCPNITGNQPVDSYVKDKNGQCYTPIDSCSVTVVSDTTNLEGGFAALLVTPHTDWLPIITDSLAKWIWGSSVDTPISPTVDETQTFTKTFVWSGTPATAILKIASDNGYSVKLNGTVVGGDAGELNYSSSDTIINLTDDLIQGVNTLEISVTNKANGATSLNTTDGNPAGLLYDLTITNTTGDCAPDDGGGNDDVLSCSITASENSIRRGRDVTINWSSVDAAYVTIPNLGDELGTSGSQLVENLGEDTTYTMTVFGDVIGNTDTREQATCSVTVDTRSGGGGGGGNRVDRTPDGDVLGASDDKKPTGEVLGAQTDAIPTGAPNTGKGGSSTEVFGQFLATPRRRNHA